MSKLSETIIGCAIQVHKALGPGLLESVYQQCLSHELKKLNINCISEVIIPISYDNLYLESGFRADLVVQDQIIVEIKSIEQLSPVHKAQILTYLKLSKKPLALLINFGETYVKNGIHRFANGPEGENL